MSTDKFLTARLPSAWLWRHFYCFLAPAALVSNRLKPDQPPTLSPRTERRPRPLRKSHHLKARSNMVSLYPLPNRREDLAVTLMVSVRNSGAPSVAQGWKLEV